MNGTYGMSHMYGNGGIIVAKTGYRILDNGAIVSLDGDGCPTSEPFTGHVSDEHLEIAAERRAAAERPKKFPRVLKSEKWPR